MDIQAFAAAYVLGNEDAQAFPEEGLFQLADARGYARDTDAFHAHVSGGAAFRFRGHTFATKSEDIAA